MLAGFPSRIPDFLQATLLALDGALFDSFLHDDVDPVVEGQLGVVGVVELLTVRRSHPRQA